MRNVRAWMIVPLSIVPATCSSGDHSDYDPATAVLLQNIAVFDAESGSMSEPQDILLDGEEIVAIRMAGSELEAEESVDCSGKYVIPGLWDSHTHLSFLTLEGEESTASTLAEFVHRGVLYVRDVGGPTDVIGRMKSQITAGEITGPEIFFTGPMFESSPLHWEPFNEDLPGFTVALNSPEDVEKELTRLAGQGATLVKTFNNIKPELYPSIVEIAREHHLKIVHDPGMALFNWVPIHTAIELGVTSIEHGKAPWPYVLKDEFRAKHDSLIGPNADPEDQGKFLADMAERGIDAISEERLQDLAELMIANDAVLCPTYRVYKGFEQEIEAMEADGELTEAEEAREKYLSGMTDVTVFFVKKLSEFGVELLIGQDEKEPEGTLEEMIFLGEIGLTELELLRGATINAATWLDVDDRYGTVEAGKIADLVVLNSNPLEDISRVGDIFMVVQHGEIVRR